MIKKLIILLSLIVLPAGRFLAQPPNPSFIRYTTEQGLSHDFVTAIEKDKEGYLWFGTKDGLNRFDGRNFKLFRHVAGDTLSLPDNQVIRMSKDARGQLWIATPGGICRFDPIRQVFYRLPTPEPLRSNPARKYHSAPTFSEDGSLWFCANGYLVHTQVPALTTTVILLPEDAGLEPEVFIDRHKRIWIHYSINLYQFDPVTESFRRYIGRQTGLMDAAGILREDDQGMLWCSSWGRGFFRYDARRDTFIDYPDGPLISTVFAFDNDADGQPFAWVSGGSDGLYLWSFPGKRLIRAEPDPWNPFSHNGTTVFDILVDKEEDIVWLATENGVEKYDPKTLRFQRALLPKADTYHQFSYVTCVAPDPRISADSILWIGAWGPGLYRWNRIDQTFRHFPSKETGSDEIFDMVFGGDGRLYQGIAGGVAIYDPLRDQWEYLKNFFPPGKKVNHKVVKLLFDRQGRLWIGCNYAGLFCYDPADGTIRPVSDQGADNSNLQRRITGLAEDGQGRIWTSTYSGLLTVDPVSLEARPVVADGLPENMPCNDIFVAGNGEIWLSSEKLIRLTEKGEIAQVYGEKEGISAVGVFGVAEDRAGNRWIAGNNGLYCLFRDGTVRRFDKSDGLYTNDLEEAFALIGSGELFIGAQHGFNYFHTGRFMLNRKPPGLTLHTVRILNEVRMVDWRQGIVLRPAENVITFEFAALNFSQPGKNRYAYRLEGFDPDWIYTDHPDATYTNLDGGRYLFRVRAANNDGIWNEEGLSIPLKVIPPFHRTPWFAGLVILVAVGITSAFFLLMRRQQFREQAIRDNIARDLHDDMGSTLSSIRFFSEVAATRATNPEVIPLLRQISDGAGQLSEAMQDIIWSINPQKDHLDDLLTRMREFGNRLLEPQGIDFRVRYNESFRAARLKATQRRNLYLIFKEAVNNAVKYGRCQEIRLTVVLENDLLIMSVSDDGCGFDPAEIAPGNGLRNMARRAEEIGGKWKVESRPGQGTRLEVQVKL